MSTENTDPELMVSWSDDGGHTWSAERRVALGGIGYNQRRAVLRRLGQTGPQGRTFRISCSAAVAKALLGASIDATTLAV